MNVPIRLASISIDLDGLDLYHSIHGLEPPDPGRDLIHEVAIPRFLELFDELGVSSTLFVVTKYLGSSSVVQVLDSAQTAGHELASHTHSHPYDLGALARSEIEAEIDSAANQMEACFGRRPRGFRSPGYGVNGTIIDCLEQRGYAYDSSIFPCPQYYLAKGLVMTLMRLRGKRSGSFMTDPRGLLAPTQPYRPHRKRFFRPGKPSRSLWEIPMCVVPGVRLPIIGTSLAVLGYRYFSAAYPILRLTQSYLNFEFHGIDLLDSKDSGVSPLLSEKQPDLHHSVAEKRDTFKRVFQRAARDYELVNLVDMTEHLSAGQPDR